MAADELLQHLRALEVALHQPAVRRDSARLAPLLHDEFMEVGRSGRRYTRADVLREFSETSSPAAIWSQDYALTELDENFVLLTYKSAHIDANGELSRHTLRSSLWQQVKGGWQLRFHQGTPTDAFSKTAACALDPERTGGGPASRAKAAARRWCQTLEVTGDH